MKQSKRNRWITIKANDIDLTRMHKIAEFKESSMSNIIRHLIKQEYDRIMLEEMKLVEMKEAFEQFYHVDKVTDTEHKQ